MEEYIRIGNGGGFTGIETVFSISRNGQIEQDGKLVDRLKKTDVEQIITNIEVLGLDQIELNQPGNIYKFIEYSMEGKTHRICWDANSELVNKNLNLYYNHVHYLIYKLIK
ncbi:MAG: hypothetical protein IPO78_05135 [Saprospiraceae bacterium]|nr:hypothetical protein [Saprospiraceae bacterium]MBK9222104.1 hypothetical protein [Saprospiraceae bacterium]MBK9720987.1 hypothetical protein [Saprospiraceae bacterium]MBK9727980.1 hypothetical protein [Saprospiraceae bacterium]